MAEELADLAQYPGKFHPLQCDITKEEDIEASLKWISVELGHVSILVNNAGVMECGYLAGKWGALFFNIKIIIIAFKFNFHNC